MRKLLCAAAAFFLCTLLCSAQELTARAAADNAVGKDNPQEAIEYINSELKKITAPAEKRSLYAFLGSLQEMISLYDDARASYAAAAGIAATDAPGMPKKSSERLVLDAIRCALSTGEYETALQYLNTAVRNSKSTEIQAEIKLYEQWAALCGADSDAVLQEPVEMLKTYISLPSMISVKPSVLLTLWYITGSKEYADILNKEFPLSAEAGIANGKVQIMPAPFWYFVLRQKTAQTSADIEILPAPQEASAETKQAAENIKTAGIAGETGSQKAETISGETEKPVKQQLGLFRDRANAEGFVSRLKEKGFNGYIQEETRESGTTYYIVAVDENEAGTKGSELKTAGFECYPLF